MTGTLLSLCVIVGLLCFFPQCSEFTVISFVRNQHIISASWKTSHNEGSCGCEDWGRTYCIGDFYFVDLLKGNSVKESQLPVPLVPLHRGPRHEKLVVWAKTAVGPNWKSDKHVTSVRNPHIMRIANGISWKVSHGKVVGQTGSYVHRLPEVAYIPHLQSVVA